MSDILGGTVVIKWEFMSSWTNCEPALAYRRGIVLSSGGTLQKLCKNACKPTADCFYEWSCTESYINTKPDLASWAYHDTFLWMSEAPYDAMIAYVSLHACCPSQITHFKSSFESSNSGVKMPYPGSFPRLFFFFFFSNKLRLSTRWNNISVFILTVALGVAVLLAPLSPSPSAVVFIDRSSESPVLQLSRCCMDTANAASSSSANLATTGHGWRIYSGFSPTWRKYSRLPIRTKIIFVVLSLSHTDHIDRSWKLDWSKKRYECSVFHSVLGLYTNDFLDLLLLYFL